MRIFGIFLSQNQLALSTLYDAEAYDEWIFAPAYWVPLHLWSDWDIRSHYQLAHHLF